MIFAAVCSTNVHASLVDGLIGYYAFENDLSDASGMGHNGIANGVVSYESGILGQGANISGFVTAPNTQLPTGSSSRTISAWASMTIGNESDEDRYVAGYGDSYDVDNSLFAIVYGIGDENYQYGAWLAGCDYDVSCNGGISGQINLNEIYNIVISYNDLTYTTSVYLNGSLYASEVRNDLTKPDTQRPASDFFIGGTYGDQFDGVIDEVGVWNRALSANEIQQLYRNPGAITAQVPEPLTILILSAGLAGIGFSRRK